MSLNSSQLDAISQQVCQRFPELKGVSPQVQNQTGPKSAGGGDFYLLIYKGKGPQNAASLVRVTADAKGRVLKMSTSR